MNRPLSPPPPPGGAPFAHAKRVQTEKENQAELATYEAKVYKASAQMADALAAELRGLKIPFFALRPSLIKESSSVSGTPQDKNVLDDRDSSKVSRSELMALQRRMLELLEDLCKE